MTLGNDQKEKILEEELYRAQVRKVAELPGSPRLKRRYFVVKGQLYDLTRKQEEQRHPHVVAHIGETAWKKVQERHAPKPGSLNVEFELAENGSQTIFSQAELKHQKCDPRQGIL
ncbi:hypothetical protein KAW55_01410 [bacterium]|nr:hypothetical protein [bacterium]